MQTISSRMLRRQSGIGCASPSITVRNAVRIRAMRMWSFNLASASRSSKGRIRESGGGETKRGRGMAVKEQIRMWGLNDEDS